MTRTRAEQIDPLLSRAADKREAGLAAFAADVERMRDDLANGRLAALLDPDRPGSLRVEFKPIVLRMEPATLVQANRAINAFRDRPQWPPPVEDITSEVVTVRRRPPVRNPDLFTEDEIARGLFP